jgi:indolepyruvate ferredoxin oxidoreductase, beta subunit
MTTNVIIAGLGGQGVITASDILAEAAFAAGFDVKKAEVHGMAQRGGSVHSDVRFGARVLSPMVCVGQADYLVVLDETQVTPTIHLLRPEGTLLAPETVAAAELPTRKSLNVAMLAVLGRHLGLPRDAWHAAIRSHLKPELHASNLALFDRLSEAP